MEVWQTNKAHPVLAYSVFEPRAFVAGGLKPDGNPALSILPERAQAPGAVLGVSTTTEKAEKGARSVVMSVYIAAMPACIEAM